jgi:hypothetical protein
MSGRLSDGKPLPGMTACVWWMSLSVLCQSLSFLKCQFVDELVEKLLAARKANAGVNNQRQVLFAKFDQHIHSQEKVCFAPWPWSFTTPVSPAN